MMSRIFGLVISLLLSGSALASKFTPGNIVVSESNTLSEYTPDGTLVQSHAVPYPDREDALCPNCEDSRDVTIINPSVAAVYNGTFSPYLSTFNAISEDWSHQKYEEWNTSNLLHYGGITSIGQYAFATDRDLNGDARGVVRFDLQNGTAARFASDIDASDISVGLNGLLYVVNYGGRSDPLHIYDPLTLIRQSTMHIDYSSAQFIAADFDGSMFVLSQSTLYHLNAGGGVIDTIDLGINYPLDLDLSSDGNIAVADRFGFITLTNRDFSTLSQFSVGINPTFASFVPIPEPTSLPLCQFISIAFLGYRRPRHLA